MPSVHLLQAGHIMGALGGGSSQPQNLGHNELKDIILMIKPDDIHGQLVRQIAAVKILEEIPYNYRGQKEKKKQA